MASKRPNPLVDETEADSRIVALPHGRVPPYDLDAERSLLGGILLDGQSLTDVVEIVKPEEFYRDAHRKVFEAMCTLFGKNEPIDRITVKDELTALGALEAVGGEVFVDILDKIVPTAANLAFYAKIVHDKALARRLIEAATAITQLGYEQHGDVGEFADECERRILAVRTGHNGASGRQRLRDAHLQLTAGQLIENPPAQRFLLRPYIPEGVVFNLSGPGASGKTTLTVHIAACRALGLPFFNGETPADGETVILSTEDRLEDYRRKLAALRLELGEKFDAERVAEKIHFFDCSGIPIRMVVAEHGQYRPTLLVDELAAVLKEKAPRADLVFMETVSRLAGGAETNESLSILVEAGQRLSRLARVSVGLVGHVSQEAGRNGIADQYAPRGGSAFGDNGRSTMVLTKLTESNRKTYAPEALLSAGDMERLLVLAHPKANGPMEDPIILERCTTEHGPVLRLAELSGRNSETAAARDALRLKRLESLRALVARLALKGLKVTERKIRDNHRDEIERDFPEKKLAGLVADAIDSGFLLQGGKVQGGGVQLLAAPRAESDDRTRDL